MFELGKWYFLKAGNRGGANLADIKRKVHCSFPPFFKVEGITAQGGVTRILSGTSGNVLDASMFWDDIFLGKNSDEWNSQFEEFEHSGNTSFEKGKTYYRTGRGAVDVLLTLGKGYTGFRDYINGHKAGFDGNRFVVTRTDKKGSILNAFGLNSSDGFNQKNNPIPPYMAAFYSCNDANPQETETGRYGVSDEDLELLDAVKFLVKYQDVINSSDRWGISVTFGGYKRDTTIHDIILAASLRKEELRKYAEYQMRQISSAQKIIDKIGNL